MSDEAQREIERQLAIDEAVARSAGGKGKGGKPLPERLWDRLDAVVAPFFRFLRWAAPPTLRVAEWVMLWAAFDKNKAGARTLFSPRRFAFTCAKLILITAVVPPFLGAGYYYATWATYRDIYVPNAGVFQSQNFVHPNGAGQIIAARDEIYTVLGKEIVDGEVVPVRFDIDVNWYFWFFRDALRPDLAASKMDSQSPYGVKCDFEATGIYTRLPRYWRLRLLKWLDLRAEIVDVVRCEEVQTLPAAFGHHS